MGFFTGEESESAKKQRENLNAQGQAASDFANQSQASMAGLSNEAGGLRQRLGDVMAGRNLVSGEMLRQGLQQNLAAQRSMAASAAPRDAAMAARTAAMQSGRLGYGMSGQAALAGMQEAANARDALANMILQQRQQDLNAALGSRQNATGAYQAVTPEARSPSVLEMAQPFINMASGGGAALLDYFGKKKQQQGQG